MAHSLLWERLHVFLDSLDPAPAPSTPRCSIPPSASASSRVLALEHALLVANVALADERARRAKWERRAVVARAEQDASRDELAAVVGRLREAEKNVKRTDIDAEDAARARRVAEEQRDVALRRLAEAPEALAALQDGREAAERGREEAVNENVALKEEMSAIREAVQKERERFVAELAERTRNFAEIESELKDARETYITAAKAFDDQRDSFAQRLQAAHAAHDAVRKDLSDVRLASQDNDQRLMHLADRCQKLEEDNAALRANKGGLSSRDANSVSSAEGCVADVIAERDELRRKVAFLSRDTAERLSSSSVSSSSDSAGVARRVLELEASLESEARDAKLLREQLCSLSATAKAKESEASQLRGEMALIHSRMRVMETVSLPKGAEELLGEDEDRKKLQQIRECARANEKKTLMTTAAEKNVNARRVQNKRRVQLSANNNAIRPWLHR